MTSAYYARMGEAECHQIHLATMNAGIMLGLDLSQLINPGTPVAVPGWNGGPYKLKTMVGNYVLADEQGVPTTLGRYYELPVFGLGGA